MGRWGCGSQNGPLIHGQITLEPAGCNALLIGGQEHVQTQWQLSECEFLFSGVISFSCLLNLYPLNIFQTPIVTQHIEKYELSEDWILSYTKSKIVPELFLRFHIFRNLQYLIFRLHEGLGAKTVYSCENGPLNCQNTNTLHRFPNF